MEPERKIEKLLRACAKKRRADAGDAFELHPATRRMLQGEVARRTPKAGGANEPSSIWNWLRLRWALPLGFALLIYLGVAVFWPAAPSKQDLAFRTAAPEKAKELSKPSTPPPIAAVDNSAPPPAPSAAPPSVVAPKTPATVTAELASANPTASPSKDKMLATTTFAETDANRPQRREVFYALTNASQPPVAVAGTLAGESVTVAPPASVPTLASEPAGGATTADLAQSVPPGAISGVAATEQLALATSSRALRVAKVATTPGAAKFKSEAMTDSLQVNATKNSQRFVQAPMKKNPPVLVSFELQQNGNQISVVDRDGSIYNGTLQMGNEDLAKARQGEKFGAVQLQQKNAGVMNTQQQTAQNYFFRVSGANRSLKQNVVFSGNLMPISNATVNAAQNFQNFAGGGGGAGGQSKLADASASQQQLFSNSRIEGTVTIGRTNQIEINALPVNQ